MKKKKIKINSTRAALTLPEITALCIIDFFFETIPFFFYDIEILFKSFEYGF